MKDSLPFAAMRQLRLLFILLVASACTTVAPRPQVARFKILQINDVYKIEGLEGGQSGGLARVRELRKHLESDGTRVLVMHAGDLLFPSVMSKYLAAEPMVDVLNLLDGDAVKNDPNLIITFGNHEFDPKDPSILLERLAESQFQWVATNTRACNPACDQRFPHTTDVYMVDLDNGMKAGIIGLLYPIKKSYMESTDVIGAARDAATAAREQGANVVIAVTHEDMGDDVELVKNIPGINLVVGGHDHLYMQQRVGNSWITKADADAKSVIVYDVTITRSTAGIDVRTTPVRVVLDTTVPKDAQVDARVQTWLDTLSKKLGGNQTIGMTTELLEGIEPVVRGRESALGNILMDAAREQMQTDIAVLNGGSIRINDNIPPGPITTYDMEGVFYYTNTLVGFRVTGQTLLDMLRNSVSRADAGDGRFLQISGFSFTYHPQDGRFIVNPEDVKIGGKPLDLNASYNVASIDYLYLHGADDGYTMFDEATRPPKVNADREADFRKTVEAYIRAKGTVTTGVEGRIVRAAH